MVAPVLFSSKVSDWGTPPEFFAKLDRMFRFTLDAAANPENAKCKVWYGSGSPVGVTDALAVLWPGRVWLNPPYGRDVGRWVRQAFLSAYCGPADLVVCLLPVRSDTEWWHKWVMNADTIYFVKGRLTFVGAKNPAPFPSCVVVFRRDGDHPTPAVRTLEAT